MIVIVTGCQGPTFVRGGSPTTMAIPPDVGPPLGEIPTTPRQVVTMRPGPAQLNDVHRLFLESQEGYEPGSGSITAIHPGVGDGPLLVLRWIADTPPMGEASCTAVASLTQAPNGISCSAPVVELGPFTVGGYTHSIGSESQEMMIEHSPDAIAVVIELSDHTSYVLRPGTSSVSLHRWEGNRPVRFTIFWNNDTTTSEILSP